MPINFTLLASSPRVLIEASLKPVAGTRIQPTGFPDLGPATYDAPDGTPTLLVESAQSMANRLEAVCWDEGEDDLAAELKVPENAEQKEPAAALPFVRAKLGSLGDGSDTTCSLLEFHRLNSPYIMSGLTTKEIKVQLKPNSSEKTFPAGTNFADVLTFELGLAVTKSKADGQDGDDEGTDVAGVINLRRLATVCFKYDPNSLVHGVFLEKIAGRLRHPRALSSFIEASGVDRADSGGVKFDRALPKPSVAGVDAKAGYGNVPFHRTEFTAKKITAFFSLDLAQLRGYGLPANAMEMLAVLSLWKVRKFLDSTMRLRSACELELVDPETICRYKDAERREQKFTLPSAQDLADQLAGLIRKCKANFAEPPVTELTWTGGKKEAGKVELDLPPDFPQPVTFGGTLKERIHYKKGSKKGPAKLILKEGLSSELIAEIEKERPDDNQLVNFLRSKFEATSGDAQGDSKKKES